MHEHLRRELFRAIHKGWRNPGDLAAIAMAHLFELCPHCRSEFESWREEVGEGVARDEGDYDGALQKVRERTAVNDLGPDAEEARLARDRGEARSRAEELLALPDDQRLDWIRNEKDRHSGLLLAEALIEECRRTTPGYPHDGYALADLARVVLHHAPVTHYAVELYALVLGQLANAIRVTGDFARADQVLGDARFILRSQAGANRLIRAELDSLEGSLRMSQFRLDRAQPLLLRALMVYRLESDREGTVKVLLQMAKNANHLRDFSRSIELCDEADQLLDESADSFLRRVSAHIRGHRLSKSGDFDSARSEVYRSLEVGHTDPLTELRARWLLSDVSAREGAEDVAEEGLLEARRGFEEAGVTFEVADIDLDLARLYRAQKRTSEALDLLDQSERVFRRLGATGRLPVLERLRTRVLAV